MKVLVVRPAPSCHELVNHLNHAGIMALPAPLLTFSTGGDIPNLSTALASVPAKSVIITISPRAVQYACQEMASQDKAWRHDLFYVAIGQKTADTWASIAGIEAHVPHVETSEGLLCMPSFSQPKGLNVIVLRGNGGRSLLGDILTENGAKIRYLETYQRHWNADKVPSLAQEWRSAGIDTIVITSGEQLSYLCKTIPTKDQQWLKECHILVPSKRIRNQAISLCFRKINCVNSTSNLMLFRALQQMKKSGKSDDRQE